MTQDPNTSTGEENARNSGVWNTDEWCDMIPPHDDEYDDCAHCGKRFLARASADNFFCNDCHSAGWHLGNDEEWAYETCPDCGEMNRHCGCYDLCEDCGHMNKDCWC